MPRSLRSDRPTKLPERRGGAAGALVAFLVIVFIIGAIGYAMFSDRSSGVKVGSLITQPVTRGPFDHIVLEQGEIESSSNIEVTCKVKSQSGGGSGGVSILWVVEEGTRVKEGDKLVELDSSALEQKLNEDKIGVITAEANVTSAKALVEQSKIARQEYLDGVYMTEESALRSEILIAEQDLVKAQKALESSQRLAAKGLIKSLQLEADRFAVANARNQLESAQGRLKVLQNLTKKKMLVQFDSDIEAAQAQLSAYESELLEEKTQLADTEQQIKNCLITAPASGVVVHANRYSSRGGSAEFVVEAGATVRERQELIYLPDPSKMQVKCNINESRITLITEGMATKISVDAIPGLSLKGRVSKVNRYAEPSSFFSSSIKEYAVTIDIIDPPESIRTGMTAEVQIFVEQLDNAVQMPIQGLYEHGGKMYALVQEGPQKFRTEEVAIGATNDTMVTIKDGVKEDDTVVLNLRDHLALMDLPEVIAEDNSDMREIANVDEDRQPPRGERPGAERGGPPGGFDGPPGGGPGGPGGFNGAPGGAPPNPAAIVQRMMERNDTDGDGSISAEEMSQINENFRSRIQSADTDGDGAVSRAELMKMMSQGAGG
ncbi:efflux RND transporter periplasmic adaptor subunit [Rhodopirellula sp. MGV]|uniref:efflux RND transporter periplasmic adaptor subunit n=1 Tax=Rhodopirellula sp. MGV TaxID=2023130 RepID=UPI000B97C41A|nr:efflux RND transporter periplasmic adaptor subunit [Rhodopirellula sp. MGV]OYP29989.1 efflux transporter periplasmic adaptor subunit [Rhodopirellula sp. MGV]PNY33444.1 efflux transporter periplasmic adaptor subunit [Rhodopirellula baltica]